MLKPYFKSFKSFESFIAISHPDQDLKNTSLNTRLTLKYCMWLFAYWLLLKTLWFSVLLLELLLCAVHTGSPTSSDDIWLDAARPWTDFHQERLWSSNSSVLLLLLLLHHLLLLLLLLQHLHPQNGAAWPTCLTRCTAAFCGVPAAPSCSCTPHVPRLSTSWGAEPTRQWQVRLQT